VSSDIRARLGRRIKALRKNRGWTQVELADLLGIDRSYLSEIENGKKDPSLTILKTFSDGFGLSLSALLRGL
jgi:transcriptional regulator with XRE-family HTH domain